MPASEIRKDAREALKGKWGKAVCIILVYLALSFVVGFIQGLFKVGSAIYTIINLAYVIISIPLSFGLLISFMKLKRGENVSCYDFFEDGFSRFGKSWGIWFHTFIRLLLPIVCLILVIIFAAVLTVFPFSLMRSSLLTVSLVLFIATIFYIVPRSLLYVIAYNISYDNPELSSKACVLKSEALMKGNRGNYFLLELSFIGWLLLIMVPMFIIAYLNVAVLLDILSRLAFDVAFIFLSAYILVSTVCFYERVAKPEVKKVEEEVKIEE